MALSANSVFEIRTAGNDTNGGGFVTGAAGTDYSQQDAKNTAGADISTTDAVADGSTTITSATANFGTTMPGNIFYMAGGTGTLAADWYQCTARASTSSITVDRTVAAGTGITMNIGGALASPGAAGAIGVAGSTYYIKAGTHVMTSATPNIAAGCFKPTCGDNGIFVRVEGYQTTRGDMGTAPVLQLNTGVSTAKIIDLSVGTYVRLVNIEVDGHGETSSRGMDISGAVYGQIDTCLARNCTNSGIAIASSGMIGVTRTRVTGCVTQPAWKIDSNVVLYACQADANSVTGFGGSNMLAIRCLAYNNSGASSDGFYISVRGIFINCTSYGNGRDGLRSGTGAASYWLNGLAEGNGGYGFGSDSAAGFNPVLVNCAGYNNTSGNVNTTAYPASLLVGFLTLTGSPFTNAGAADFSLNNTAGAGAAVRAVSYPATFLDGLTATYLDIGAAQHADPVGGGGAPRSAGMSGGIF